MQWLYILGFEIFFAHPKAHHVSSLQVHNSVWAPSTIRKFKKSGPLYNYIWTYASMHKEKQRRVLANSYGNLLILIIKILIIAFQRKKVPGHFRITLKGDHLIFRKSRTLNLIFVIFYEPPKFIASSGESSEIKHSFHICGH